MYLLAWDNLVLNGVQNSFSLFVLKVSLEHRSVEVCFELFDSFARLVKIFLHDALLFLKHVTLRFQFLVNHCESVAEIEVGLLENF